MLVLTLSKRHDKVKLEKDGKLIGFIKLVFTQGDRARLAFDMPREIGVGLEKSDKDGE